MIRGHDHHIPGARQVSAILIARAARSRSKAASVTVEHDWPLAPVRCGRPDVEKQAILVRRRFVSALARLLDRFHIVKHLNAAVDAVRRELWRQLRSKEKVEVKGTRWLLLKNPVELDQ